MCIISFPGGYGVWEPDTHGSMYANSDEMDHMPGQRLVPYTAYIPLLTLEVKDVMG
jgi:hypothetical protein